MNRNLHRCALRFERTASAAFRDYEYGACIERPVPSVWSLFRDYLVRLLADMENKRG